MKRVFSLLFAVLLILSMSPGVRADIIYIPEDPFLEDHMESCTREDRNYLALVNTNLYRSPENDHVEFTFPQGAGIPIYYTYTDARDIVWGYTESYEHDCKGWVPMAYLELVYDYISFEEDYGDQFQHLDEWLYLDEACAGQEIHFWSYPGSEWDTPIVLGPNPENLPAYGIYYNDDAGRRWVYINYYMGLKDKWVCASDPTADFATLYPYGVPDVAPSAPEATLPEAEIKPGKSGGLSTDLVIGIGVVGCVVITCAVLAKRKKK